MNQYQVKAQIEKYKDKIDVDKAIKSLDSNLKLNKLDYSNITCIFVYNYEDQIKFSPLTSPSYNIDIFCKKF